MKNKFENINTRWQQWLVGLTLASFVLICLYAGFTKVSNFVTRQADSSEEMSKGVVELPVQSPPRIINDNAVQPVELPSETINNCEVSAEEPVRIAEIVTKPLPPSERPKSTKEAPALIVYGDVEVKMVNVSGKTITGFITPIKYPQASSMHGTMQMQMHGDAVKGKDQTHIAPCELFTIRGYVMIPQFSVQIYQVNFDDKTTWVAKGLEDKK